MTLKNILCAALSATGFVALAGDPLGIPTYVETVTAEFASAADADKAQMTVAPLPGGKTAAFTTRWDDTTPAHADRMEMFKRIGINGTFFLNSADGFFKDEKAPGSRIKALGGRFGNHTRSHPFLMESGVNRMLPEVMANKIAIECACDTPVTSFVIPYSWSCALEPSRAAKLAKILVATGHFVSSDWPLDVADQPASAWMPGNTFGANDGAPEPARFASGLKDAIASVAKKPDYPKITFGIHSWCKPEGLLVQEKFLKEGLAAHPEFWVTDDAHYGAYRYEFWHAAIKKIGVRGKIATFEVTRHDPAYLGEVQDLDYAFGDVKPVKVTAKAAARPALPAKIDRMKDGASAKFPDAALTFEVDEAKGALSYAFKSPAGAKVVNVVVNPAPMWSESRINSSAAKATVKLGEKNAIADYQEGGHYYAVGVDFLLNGERCRLYADTTVKGRKGAVGGTPRDTVLVLGPIPEKDFVEADWMKLAVPEATLPNRGDGISEYWRSMADKARCGFSAAAYIPWDGAIPEDFKDAMKKITDKDPLFLAAVDFECAADGEKDLLINKANWEKTTFYLNGEKTDAKGGVFRIKVKKGLNRLIYKWTWPQPWHPKAYLLSVCDDKDVNTAVKFVTPKTEKRKGVFASDGFNIEFTNVGAPRNLFDGETKIAENIGVSFGGSLAKKTDRIVKATFEESKDKLVCTTDCPLGTRSDDYACKSVWTVTADSLAFEGQIQVREGVAWKSVLAESRVDIPIPVLTAGPVSSTDAKGAETPREIAKTYVKSNDFGGWTSVRFGNGYRLVAEGCTGGATDRRQWGQPQMIMKFGPAGGTNWGAPKADSRVFSWKFRLERVR